MCQVLLQPSPAELLKRLQARAKTGGHFMPASMLESQLATLEPEGKNIIVIQGTTLLPLKARQSVMPAPLNARHLLNCSWRVRLRRWCKHCCNTVPPSDVCTPWSGDADAEEMLASFLSYCHASPKPL